MLLLVALVCVLLAALRCTAADNIDRYGFCVNRLPPTATLTTVTLPGNPPAYTMMPLRRVDKSDRLWVAYEEDSRVHYSIIDSVGGVVSNSVPGTLGLFTPTQELLVGDGVAFIVLGGSTQTLLIAVDPATGNPLLSTTSIMGDFFFGYGKSVITVQLGTGLITHYTLAGAQLVQDYQKAIPAQHSWVTVDFLPATSPPQLVFSDCSVSAPCSCGITTLSGDTGDVVATTPAGTFGSVPSNCNAEVMLSEVVPPKASDGGLGFYFFSMAPLAGGTAVTMAFDLNTMGEVFASDTMAVGGFAVAVGPAQVATTTGMFGTSIFVYDLTTQARVSDLSVTLAAIKAADVCGVALLTDYGPVVDLVTTQTLFTVKEGVVCGFASNGNMWYTNNAGPQIAIFDHSSPAPAQNNNHHSSSGGDILGLSPTLFGIVIAAVVAIVIGGAGLVCFVRYRAGKARRDGERAPLL